MQFGLIGGEFFHNCLLDIKFGDFLNLFNRGFFNRLLGWFGIFLDEFFHIERGRVHLRFCPFSSHPG